MQFVLPTDMFKRYYPKEKHPCFNHLELQLVLKNYILNINAV